MLTMLVQILSNKCASFTLSGSDARRSRPLR
jgi:hypothetical protein